MLLVVAAAQGLAVAVDLPETNNHQLFVAMAAAALLGGAAVELLRERRSTPRRELDVQGVLASAFELFRPAGRGMLVALYAFAVFHKLNFDFFAPATSCASRFLGAFVEDPPPLASHAAIWGSLSVEFLIPVLLLIRRSRRLGVVVGVVFHGVLGGLGYYAFSAALLPFYSLWWVSTGSLGTWPRLQGGRGRVMPDSRGLALLGVLGLLYLTRRQWPTMFEVAAPSAYVVLVIVVVVVLLGKTTGAGESLAPTMERRAASRLLAAIFVGLVAFNGLQPYMGLRTQAVWSMFSNLRTEARQSNHWVMRSSWQPFDYQRDVAVISESSLAGLARASERGQGIVWLELLRRVREAQGRGDEVSVAAIRDGEIYETERIESLAGTSPRWWELRLLRFRPVVREGPTSCDGYVQ